MPTIKLIRIALGTCFVLASCVMPGIDAQIVPPVNYGGILGITKDLASYYRRAFDNVDGFHEPFISQGIKLLQTDAKLREFPENWPVKGDQDGYLTQAEWMAALIYYMAKQDTQKRFQTFDVNDMAFEFVEVDSNKDGLVSFEEFKFGLAIPKTALLLGGCEDDAVDRIYEEIMTTTPDNPEPSAQCLNPANEPAGIPQNKMLTAVRHQQLTKAEKQCTSCLGTHRMPFPSRPPALGTPCGSLPWYCAPNNELPVDGTPIWKTQLPAYPRICNPSPAACALINGGCTDVQVGCNADETCIPAPCVAQLAELEDIEFLYLEADINPQDGCVDKAEIIDTVHRKDVPKCRIQQWVMDMPVLYPPTKPALDAPLRTILGCDDDPGCPYDTKLKRSQLFRKYNTDFKTLVTQVNEANMYLFCKCGQHGTPGADGELCECDWVKAELIADLPADLVRSVDWQAKICNCTEGPAAPPPCECFPAQDWVEGFECLDQRELIHAVDARTPDDPFAFTATTTSRLRAYYGPEIIPEVTLQAIDAVGALPWNDRWPRDDDTVAMMVGGAAFTRLLDTTGFFCLDPAAFDSLWP
ncbi:hypothetical protein HK104_006707 [Borealophlyctis nickersoniae]|nr:hypothetical protein HK104_006707 [Borealophlyctis nickersoniae]